MMDELERHLVDAITWVMGNDTGSSSRALLLSSVTGKYPNPADYPRDAGDIGRCVRLLTKMPWVYPHSMVGWSAEWRTAWSKIEKRWENGELTP